MKITVGLSPKSIDKAIKQVEWYRKHFVRLIPKMLSRFADRVAELANEKIEGFDYDAETIAGIKSGWVKEDSEGGLLVTLSNTYEKAVYIEFGVGRVGEQSPHKSAEEAGYDYDRNAHGNKGWAFQSKEGSPVDLQRKDYKVFYKNNSEFWIRTRGSGATMFLYNAAMDFVDKKEFVPIVEKFLSGVEWI